LNNHRRYLAASGLILLLFALLVAGAPQLSATADEPSHLAAGYALLARGSDGLWTLPYRGHPLGVDAWLALPIYIARPGVPLEHLDGWQSTYAQFVNSFLPYLDPLERSLLAARLQSALLTVLLAAVVYRWASDLWGWPAGMLALGVMAFDPTLLAHGRLATNDVGVTALGTLTLYLAWRWTRVPGWYVALGVGVLSALTMLAKASGVLWAAAAGVLMVAAMLRAARGMPRRREETGRPALQVAAAGLVALLLLWASYGFSWGPVHGLPLSLPAPQHWQGLFFQTNSADDRWAFALGLRRYGSWWWYFPLAFVLKNPLPLLVGAAAGAIVLARRASDHRWLDLAFFPMLYLLILIWKGLNVGYRHVLPVHPFLYLLIAGGLTALRERARREPLLKTAGLVLAAWYVAGTLAVFPDQIAYFNELVGGPDGGYRYLVDSNLAWGQSSGARQAYLDAYPATHSAPPAARFQPEAGRYIVNASYLQGVGLGDPYTYEWFRHREPVEIVRHSLLVYDVPPFEVGWVAQCETPRAPLSDKTLAGDVGQEDVHAIRFDCTQAWIYPGAGRQGGLYALDRTHVAEGGIALPSLLAQDPLPRDPLIAGHLRAARLSFDQNSQPHGFVLYEMPPGVVQYPAATPVYACRDNRAPAASLEERLIEGSAAAPLALDGPLAFLGAAAYPTADAWQVETWWRVTAGPIARPFSILGQLVSAEGEVWSMYDKLSVSPLTLLEGDVLVQRHLFAAPPQESEAWLRTGAYWLDDMQRWPVSSAPGADALLLRLDREQIVQKGLQAR
jgi:hypothetical protein